MLQKIFQFGFVVEFENETDREYYVNKDPDHAAFVASLPPEGKRKAGVMDFEEGVF